MLAAPHPRLASANLRPATVPCVAALGDGVSDFDGDGDAMFVGVARVTVPQNVRDRVKNEAILKMAIREVAETLYVFVVGAVDAHTSVAYVSELHDVTWDLACVLGRRDIDFKIASEKTSTTSWNDLFALPELEVVYGEYNAAPCAFKSLTRNGLLPVAHRYPVEELKKALFPGFEYIGDGETTARTFDVVIVNGTFDRLHNGHKKLLALAVSACTTRLVVGLTAREDVLAALPFAETVEPLELRKSKVQDFVASVKPSLEVECVDMDDRWSPIETIRDTTAAVVISTEDIEQFWRLYTTRIGFRDSMLYVLVVRRADRFNLSSRRTRERLINDAQ